MRTAAGRYPRVRIAGSLPWDGGGRTPDYVTLGRLLQAPPPTEAPRDRPWSALEARTGFKMSSALIAKHDDADAYLSMSEQVGLPLAVLDRGRRPHTVITHNLTTRLKSTLHSTIRWLNWFDAVIVFNQPQIDFLRECGVPEERCHLVEYFVDDEFFTPTTEPRVPDLVSSFGLEHRDYETLAEAARLRPDIQFEVYARSLWAKDSEQRDLIAPPPNLTLMPFANDLQLRAAYRRSAAVVAPVRAGTRLAAGVTSILEAKATATPVLGSNTPGLSRYLTSGALPVPPGDSGAIAETLTGLLGDTKRMAQLGSDGLASVKDRHRLVDYSTTISEIVLGTCTED